MSRAAASKRQEYSVLRLDGGSAGSVDLSRIRDPSRSPTTNAATGRRGRGGRTSRERISLTRRNRSAGSLLLQRAIDARFYDGAFSHGVVCFYEIDDCYDIYARGPEELDWPGAGGQVPVRKLSGEKRRDERVRRMVHES